MERIRPFPAWSDLKSYQISFLRRDVTAALTVALLALPQAMAYAFLAGLPTSAGVWSAIFGAIFASAFGFSRFLVAGTTSTIAILIETELAEFLTNFHANSSEAIREAAALNLVLEIVLVVGILQLLAAFFGLGRVTHFTSRAVIIGYMAGVAFAIALSQLFPFLGIERGDAHALVYRKGWHLISNLPLTHYPSALIGVFSLVVLLLLYRFSKKIPASAIVFVLAALAVPLFQLNEITFLSDIAPIKQKIPTPHLPYFEWGMIAKVLHLSFAIAFLTVLESTAIGRNYARAKEPTYQDSQEVYGIGVANILCSFLGSMPISGGFTQSAANEAAGAKTRFAAFFSGILVFLGILFLGDLFALVPIAALSALILFTAYHMVNFRDLAVCLKASKSDAFVVAATFFSTWIFKLDVALFIGILLSILLYLRRAAKPSLVEYNFTQSGKLRRTEEEDERLDPRICIVLAEGEMFFAAADSLQSEMRKIGEDERVEAIILQLFDTRSVDASACLALKNIAHNLKATGRHFLLAGVSQEIFSILAKTGVLQEIGPHNCFLENTQIPSAPTRSAYAQAKSLIKS